MEKSKILLVGIGQGAGNLVDDMLSKSKKYNGLFFNSSLGDIKPLKNADLDKNVFIYPGADGSGRDRSKADAMIRDNANAIGEKLKSYPQTDLVVVFTTMSGGTGSGSIKTFIKITKMALPSAKINVVAVLPNYYEEDELSLRNAIECWNDINSVMNLISDIKFVDNTKRRTYNDINKEVVELLDSAYGMVGIHKDGNIDKNDSFRINTAEGTGLVLMLEDNFRDAKVAIDRAIKSSIFALPNSYDCDYLGINVKQNGYNPSDIAEEFEVFKTTYKTYNNNFNLVVLGGLETPKEAVEVLELSLKERTNRRSTRNKSRSVIINLDDSNENNKKSKPVKKEINVYEEDDFDLLFDDDFMND